MNTENKLRIWNGREMVYDVVSGRFGTFYVNPMAKGDGLNDNDTACLTPFNTKYSDEVPVMRPIGLTDKNGIEIWEGDKIKTPNNDWGVVVWKAPFFEVTVSETQSSMYSREWFSLVEVIGNIYQNPIN